MGVNEEALQLHAVYKKPYFLLQVMRESASVQQVTQESASVLQVTQESVSGTTSHTRIRIRYILQVMCTASERAMKSKVHMIKSLSP